ncbi:MAG: hypothetical protein K6A82_07360 [Prevotella sp.]|nr:hypothetical protein [Prevotella sp.]
MKSIILTLLLAVTVLLAACGSGKKDIDQGELAARAAKLYYEQLLEGKYEAFLEGENRPDSLPDGYKGQLLLNLRQFVAQQDSLHRGIDSISIASSVFSAKDSTASAFLIFHYGDRTSEQVVVPMVKKKGVWMMR